jgi:hypothetical protein
MTEQQEPTLEQVDWNRRSAAQKVLDSLLYAEELAMIQWTLKYNKQLPGHTLDESIRTNYACDGGSAAMGKLTDAIGRHNTLRAAQDIVRQHIPMKRQDIENDHQVAK